jgi:hypothetical protein
MFHGISNHHHSWSGKYFERGMAYGTKNITLGLITSVAEPYHFCAAPGENFAAAPAPAAPAPSLLYSRAKFLKRIKV